MAPVVEAFNNVRVVNMAAICYLPFYPHGREKL